MITHEADEAVFLSDRIVLMSNGPAATSAKVVEVPIPRPRPRPRPREALLEDPHYLAIRKERLQYLIGTGHAAAA